MISQVDKNPHSVAECWTNESISPRISFRIFVVASLKDSERDSSSGPVFNGEGSALCKAENCGL